MSLSGADNTNHHANCDKSKPFGMNIAYRSEKSAGHKKIQYGYHFSRKKNYVQIKKANVLGRVSKEI